jgi:hypothetical protein
VIVSFERCVRAIAEVIAVDSGLCAGSEKDKVASFLLATCARTPDHIRLGLKLGTCAFDASALVRFGKPFNRLPIAKRRSQLLRWERSRFEAFRSLAAFYRSLGLFAAHSIGVDDQAPASRPAKSRGRRSLA